LPEIIRITSEALQQTIRRLLPSQQGFGDDLQATNLITPIIDLTPTAEGSALPTYLQTALAFGSNTQFLAENNTVTLANSGGFWRIIGISNIEQDSGSSITSEIKLSDGLGSKWIFKHQLTPGTGDNGNSVIFDYTIFLRPGDSVTAFTNSSDAVLTGSYRQVADLQGNIVNPVGFSAE
jgi:hypothetical protein